MLRLVGLIASLSLMASVGAQEGKRIEDGNPNILERKDVQAELHLSQDQIAKVVKEVEYQANREVKAMTDVIEQVNGVPDQSVIRAEKKKLQPAHLKNLKAILDDAQWQRFNELRVQIGGYDVLRYDAFQTVLPLTKEQIGQIDELLNQEYLRDVEYYKQAFANGPLDKEESFKYESENRAKTRAEIGKLLTPEQLEKLKKLGGAPFTPTKG